MTERQPKAWTDDEFLAAGHGHQPPEDVNAGMYWAAISDIAGQMVSLSAEWPTNTVDELAKARDTINFFRAMKRHAERHAEREAGQ